MLVFIFIYSDCNHSLFQWTYYTANNWGGCKDGTQGVGCGAQETFRACSDIKISTNGPKNPPRYDKHHTLSNDIIYIMSHDMGLGLRILAIWSGWLWQFQ